MKQLVLLCATVLVSTMALAYTDAEMKQIAARHLASQDIKGDMLVLDQNTAKNQMWVELYSNNDREIPCHTGVIISKASGRVNMGEGDSEIKTEYPYYDTFVDTGKQVYEFCAD